jgi:hypothetical protein
MTKLLEILGKSRCLAVPTETSERPLALSSCLDSIGQVCVRAGRSVHCTLVSVPVGIALTLRTRALQQSLLLG